MMDDDAAPYWTAKDAADYANVCTQTIYDACNLDPSDPKFLEHVRIGGRLIRLRREWVRDWIARQAIRARPPQQRKLWESSNAVAVRIKRSVLTTTG